MKNASHHVDIGKYKILLDTVPSTQAYAVDLLKSFPIHHGTVISCLDQTHGKGRLEKSWTSKRDQNFTASIILKDYSMFANIQGDHISKLISVAVVKTLLHFLKEDVMIKWPNDIIYKSKKLAGILITNQWRGNNLESSVVGIGINVNQLDFDHAPQAGSIKSFLKMDTNLSDITKILLEQLNHWYSFIQENNFHPIDEFYHLHLFGTHYQIQVATHSTNTIELARVIHVEEDGRIKLEFKNQSTQIFDMDEIKILF